MPTPTDSPIRLTGQQYIDKYLDPILTRRNVKRTHVDITLNAAASSITLLGREFSTEGEAGQFKGSKTITYLKQDLSLLYPYPVLYAGTYPLTYRVLLQLLREQYGWVIEDGEFSLRPYNDNGSVGMPVVPTLDSVVDLTPARNTGKIDLVARAQSIRFKTGSVLKLLVQPVEGRTRVEALYPIVIDAPMASLRDDLDLITGARTLFSSTGEQAVRELVRRNFGFIPDSDQFTMSYASNGATLEVTGTAKDRDSSNAVGRYSNAFKINVLRENLDTVIPYPLNIDGTYAMSWANFKSFMINSFGLTVEAGEFYIASDSTRTPLGEGSTVLLQPGDRAQDSLVATANSKRWVPGSKLTYHLVFRDQVVVFGNLEDGTEGDRINYQYQIQGGTGPYTVSNITGLPSGFTLSDTGLLTGTAAIGSYTLYAQFTDARGNIGFLIDDFVFAEQPYDPLVLVGKTLALGRINEVYLQDLSITGGKLPYSNPRVVEGRLPNGLSLSIQGNSLRIAGTPTEEFNTSFKLAVNSANNKTAEQTYLLKVEAYDPLVFENTTPAPAYVGMLYQQYFPLRGGKTPYLNPRVSAGMLPDNGTLRIDGTNVLLEAYPTREASYNVTLEASSSDGQTTTLQVAINAVLKETFAWGQKWFETPREVANSDVKDVIWIEAWQKWVTAENDYRNSTSTGMLLAGPHPTFMERIVPSVNLDMRSFQSRAVLAYSPELNTLVVSSYFNGGALVGGENGTWEPHRFISNGGTSFTAYSGPIWVPFLQKFAMYGRSIDEMAYSSNGYEWTAVKLGSKGGSRGAWIGLYVDPLKEEVVLLRDDGVTLTSQDLISWTAVGTHPIGGNQGTTPLRWSEALGAIVLTANQGWSNAGVNYSPGVFYSYDRTTWTAIPGTSGNVTSMVDLPQYGEMWFAYRDGMRRWRAGSIIGTQPFAVDETRQVAWSKQQQRVFMLTNSSYWTTDEPPVKPKNLVWDDGFTMYDRQKATGGSSIYSYGIGRVDAWDKWLLADHGRFVLGSRADNIQPYPGFTADFRSTSENSCFAYSPELDRLLVTTYFGLALVTNPDTGAQVITSTLENPSIPCALTWVSELGKFFVLDGVYENVYYSSANGTSWTRHVTTELTSNGNNVRGFAWHPKLKQLVWLRRDGSVWTSSDGVAWASTGAHPFGSTTSGQVMAWSTVLDRMVVTNVNHGQPTAGSGLYVSENLKDWLRLELPESTGLVITSWTEAPNYGEILAHASGRIWRYTYGVWRKLPLPMLNSTSWVQWSATQERFLVFTSNTDVQGLYLSKPDPEAYTGTGFSTAAKDHYGATATLTNNNNQISIAAGSNNSFLRRAARANRTGKRYFEIVVPAAANGSLYVGLCDPNSTLTGNNPIALPSPSVMIRSNGEIYYNGIGAAMDLLGTWISGTTLRVFVDFAEGRALIYREERLIHTFTFTPYAPLVPYVAANQVKGSFVLRTQADQFKFRPGDYVAWGDGEYNPNANFSIRTQLATFNNGVLSLTTTAESQWTGVAENGSSVVIEGTVDRLRGRALFAGQGYLVTPAANSDLNFGAGDFTITMEVTPQSYAGQSQPIFGSRHSTYGEGGRFLVVNGESPGGNNIPRRFGFGGYQAGDPLLQSNADVVLNKLVELTISRTGTLVTMLVDGVVVAEATVAAGTTYDFNQSSFGAVGWSTTRYTGWVENVRFIKGVGLHGYYKDKFFLFDWDRAGYFDSFVPTKDWSGSMWADGGGDAFDNGGRLMKLYPQGDVNRGSGVEVDLRGGAVLGAFTTQDVVLGSQGQQVRLVSGWATQNMFVAQVYSVDGKTFSMDSWLQLGSDGSTTQMFNRVAATLEGAARYAKIVHSDDSNPMNPAAGDPMITYSIIPMDLPLSQSDSVGRAFGRMVQNKLTFNEAWDTPLVGEDPSWFISNEGKGFTLVIGWGTAGAAARNQWIQEGLRIGDRPNWPAAAAPIPAEMSIDWTAAPTWPDTLTITRDFDESKGAWGDGGNDAFDNDGCLATAKRTGLPDVMVPLTGRSATNVLTSLNVPVVGLNKLIHSRSGWLSDRVWAAEVMGGDVPFTHHLQQGVGSDGGTQYLVRRVRVNFPGGEVTVKILHTADSADKLSPAASYSTGDPAITWMMIPRSAARALGSAEHWTMPGNLEGADNTITAGLDPVTMVGAEDVNGYTLLMTWGYSDYVVRETELLKILRLHGQAPIVDVVTNPEWYITSGGRLYGAEWNKFANVIDKGENIDLFEVTGNELIEVNYSQSVQAGRWRPFGESVWRPIALGSHGRCVIGTKIWSMNSDGAVKWFDTATGLSGDSAALYGNTISGCKKLIVKYIAQSVSYLAGQVSIDGGLTWTDHGTFIGYAEHTKITNDGHSVMLVGWEGGNINIGFITETGTITTRQLTGQAVGDRVIGVVALVKGWMIVLRSGKVFTSPEDNPLNFTAATGFQGTDKTYSAASDGERVMVISSDGLLWTNNDFAEGPWTTAGSPVNGGTYSNISLRGKQFVRYNVADEVVGVVTPSVWYRLNDAAPNGVVRDSSGNGRHGTYYPVAPVGTALSNGGKSLGTNGRVTGQGFTFPGLPFTENATNPKGQFWSVFLQRDPNVTQVGGQYQHIVGNSGDSGLRAGFQVDTADGQVQWNMMRDHQATSMRPRTPIPDRKRHMYTVVYRPQAGRDRFSSYVDGKVVATIEPNSTNLPAVVNELLYGGSPNDYSASYGNGTMMAELMAGPGWDSDSEESTAIAKLYDLLKSDEPEPWVGEWEAPRMSMPGSGYQIGQGIWSPTLNAYVAAYGPQAYTTDGITWYEIGMPENLFSVADLPGKGIMMPNGSGKLYHNDGASGWQQYNVDNVPDRYVFSTSAPEALHKVVGFSGSGVHVNTGDDLKTGWAFYPDVALRTNTQAVYNEDLTRWITIGSNDGVASQGGLNGTLAYTNSMGSDTSLLDICYSNVDGFSYMVGDRGIYRTDGANRPKTVLSMGTGQGKLIGVIYCPEIQKVVAYGADYIWVGLDTEWVRFNSPFPATPWYGMGWLPNERRLVAWRGGTSRRSTPMS